MKIATKWFIAAVLVVISCTSYRRLPHAKIYPIDRAKTPKWLESPPREDFIISSAVGESCEDARKKAMNELMWEISSRISQFVQKYGEYSIDPDEINVYLDIKSRGSVELFFLDIRDSYCELVEYPDSSYYRYYYLCYFPRSRLKILSEEVRNYLNNMYKEVEAGLEKAKNLRNQGRIEESIEELISILQILESTNETPRTTFWKVKALKELNSILNNLIIVPLGGDYPTEVQVLYSDRGNWQALVGFELAVTMNDSTIYTAVTDTEGIARIRIPLPNEETPCLKICPLFLKDIEDSSLSTSLKQSLANLEIELNVPESPIIASVELGPVIYRRGFFGMIEGIDSMYLVLTVKNRWIENITVEKIKLRLLIRYKNEEDDSVHFWSNETDRILPMEKQFDARSTSSWQVEMPRIILDWLDHWASKWDVHFITKIQVKMYGYTQSGTPVTFTALSSEIPESTIKRIMRKL